jgi:Domain of unknown function (DUF1707)
MVETDAMRASDRDRQDVVDRLRGAVGDGRLRMDEYMERMEAAYQAVTVGDLAPLCADLPTAGAAVAEREPDSLGAPPATAMADRPCFAKGLTGSVARLPGTLRVLWSIWLTAVLVNVVVWVLVSVTTGHLPYPWPLWVAGPYGAVLFALSVGASQARRSRP